MESMLSKQELMEALRRCAEPALPQSVTQALNAVAEGTLMRSTFMRMARISHYADKDLDVSLDPFLHVTLENHPDVAAVYGLTPGTPRIVTGGDRRMLRMVRFVTAMDNLDLLELSAGRYDFMETVQRQADALRDNVLGMVDAAEGSLAEFPVAPELHKAWEVGIVRRPTVWVKAEAYTVSLMTHCILGANLLMIR